MAKTKTLTVVKDEDEQAKDAAPEAEVDKELVNEAAVFIRDAIRKTVERGFQEIGEYLFDKFFYSDPALVRSKSPHKAESFRALLERSDTLDLLWSRALADVPPSRVFDGHRRSTGAVSLPDGHRASAAMRGQRAMAIAA